MYNRYKTSLQTEMSSNQSPKMEYNFLGNSGLKVSNICLGTMTMGTSAISPFFSADNPSQMNEADSHQMLDRFAELGGNFLDTADIYSAGGSEEIVGNWLSKNERERFIVATKVRFGWNRTEPNGTGLSRKRIMSCIDNSLRRLKTDYVDLYQIHCWDEAVPIKETLGALNDLVRCGKVRYVGGSNLTGWQLQKITDLCEKMGFSQFISLQQQYNLLTRENEFEVVDVCKNEGIGIIPWSPLKGGLLTGKYKRHAKVPEKTRMGYNQQVKIAPEYQKVMESDRYWNLVKVLDDISKETGKTVAQVSLRWLLQKECVPSVIIGATKISQVEDNIGASTGWSLTADQMKQLDEASKPDLPYPYNFLKNMNADRCNKSKI
ncbi:1-deoxyxylulose-5-phosphate synthase YajO-like [Liolophura sinensis]|uniref:1-deoxyxylulose-5-phosphate synthase YajO-like n=1 Tax=Liolophura sinensis TaxID=3198878 RepID=UPI0031591776